MLKSVRRHHIDTYVGPAVLFVGETRTRVRVALDCWQEIFLDSDRNGEVCGPHEWSGTVVSRGGLLGDARIELPTGRSGTCVLAGDRVLGSGGAPFGPTPT